MRRDGICPHCGVNLRPARPDGTLRGWCRACESAQKREYYRTDAGKATQRRYLASDKGKAAIRRSATKWLASEKGRAWLASDEYKEMRKAVVRRYRASEKGKAMLRRRQQRRRLTGETP